MWGHPRDGDHILLLDLHADFVGFCFIIIHVSAHVFLLSFFMFVLYFTIKSFKEWNYTEHMAPLRFDWQDVPSSWP